MTVMDSGPLARIDSFPYRHRLSDVMTAPAVIVPPAATLTEVAKMMDVQRISSVLVGGPVEGVAAGIVTERDVLAAVSRSGASALEFTVERVMSSPVESLPPDAMVYRALGRMDRLRVRHLAIVDAQGRALGIVSARALLKQRVGSGLAIGDGLAAARDPGAIRALRDGLPKLAADLIAEQVAPLDVTAVISEVMRETTARAAELALDEMKAAGRGAPPAPFAVMVLGSGGRGESQLAPDQDNALIHAGSDADDPWYERFATIMNERLDQAGVPYCKGGVMASRPLWRHSVDGWRKMVSDWIAAPKPEALLNVDIFFDFQPVWGDRSIAEDLRDFALDRAKASIVFLKLLTVELASYNPPIGFLGGFRLTGDRLDLKIGGLFPLVAGARALALRAGAAATATPERLKAAAAVGRIQATDLEQLTVAHQMLVGLMLRQQIDDVAAGREPGNLVDVRRLDRPVRSALKTALKGLGDIPETVRQALVD